MMNIDAKQDHPRLAKRLLDVIENDILPLTERGVTVGDKVFGAAVLLRSDLSLVNAGTNEENTDCPLWHGEMVALREYHRLPERPSPDRCLLLSTHEPCPMCAAAISWCGIPEVYFLFDYRDTEAQFAIPHDIRMLRELFSPATGLNRDNSFFTATPIRELGADSARIDAISRRYDALSRDYQTGKDDNDIPLR